MAKILLKRVPPKTNGERQKKAMREWSAVIVERYSSGQDIPIVAAGKHRGGEGNTAIPSTGKKN